MLQIAGVSLALFVFAESTEDTFLASSGSDA